MRQGLIFDLDGTLWDSTGVIRPVWNGVLAEHGLPPMSEEEMAGLMGLPKAALAARAARLFPMHTLPLYLQALYEVKHERYAEALPHLEKAEKFFKKSILW
jgi:phosphoglycolate phosphatase-like HAD superfamily hydrolase